MSGDQLVVRGDESQVMEQPGPPEVPDGGAPAGGVVVPLEPQDLPGQIVSHLAALQSPHNVSLQSVKRVKCQNHVGLRV